MFIINMFVLQIYQQNSYSCWLKQNQWLLTDRRTDRQLLYLRQLASLSAPPENKIKLGSTLHAQYYRTTEIACRLPGNTWLLGSIEIKLMLEKIHKLIINENYQFKYKRKLKLLMIIIYTDGKLQTHIYHKNYFQ